MKKLIYIANIRLPTEKAHGIQIMKTCEAFSSHGIDVVLFVPRRRNDITQDPFEYYAVKKTFSIYRIFSLDLVRFGKIGFLIQSFLFSLAVFYRACRAIRKNENVVFYSRDEMPLSVLSLFPPFHRLIIWEAHMGHMNIFTRSLIRQQIPIIAISQGLEELYRFHGAKNILVVADGVDVKQFKISEEKKKARAMLGFPEHGCIVLYAGHLYSWKGVDTLARAASGLTGDVRVVFVGGTKKDAESFTDTYGGIKNIQIVGWKPHNEIPLYLKAADVLVIPNSGKEKISRLYTSPMKLFEYMASGTPIIASDLPSLREILNDRNAVFFKPDDPESLAESIHNLLADPKKQEYLSRQQLSDIIQYSWDSRAKRIISFIYHD